MLSRALVVMKRSVARSKKCCRVKENAMLCEMDEWAMQDVC